MAKKNPRGKQHEMSIHKAIRDTLILSAAYLMECTWPTEDIKTYFETISRWHSDIDNHWLSITKVKQIYEEVTGEKIKW